MVSKDGERLARANADGRWLRPPTVAPREQLVEPVGPPHGGGAQAGEYGD
jgi:hypothetical protein